MKRGLITVLSLGLVVEPAQAAEIDQLRKFRAQIEETLGREYRVLAVCGASSGKAFYRDELQKGWQDDAVSGGRLIFVTNSQGQQDLMFANVTGEIKSASLDGGLVLPIHSNDSTGAFIWVVAYPSTGVTETYNVSPSAEELRVALWTSSKPTLSFPTNPPVSLDSKVSAFVARCA